ncbi:hypothetical protein [Streptomyces macrosporus]|uniref:Oxidoreductase FAD/NAD(P)-binding domain-containing protein n=1 Tax=Streptomyces macrosporus TaxID=44032 RepID=A0ABP5WWB0_9ACTN
MTERVEGTAEVATLRPADDERAISVKRIAGDPAGEVSTWLHEHVREGDVLTVGEPFGDVVLDEGDGPVLPASAGIGCTPLIGMPAHLVAAGSPRSVTVVHGDRGQAAHAHRERMELLVGKLPDASAHVRYERPEGPWPAERTGYVDLSDIETPEGVRAYLCGPVPFMRAVRTQPLERGVPASRIHYESFGPDLGLDAA